MRNLFINLTCIALFALSATTLTANAKIYSPQENTDVEIYNSEESTGGYVVIIPLVNFTGEYDVMVSIAELGQRKMDANLIIISAFPVRGGEESILAIEAYEPGIEIEVEDLIDINTGVTLESGEEYVLVINQGGRLVDRYGFVIP